MKSFEWLFRRHDMSDCTVELSPDGDTFPGHRLVLAMHSPVIKVRVEKWSRDDESRVVVVDCPESSEAGNNVIRWMYTQDASDNNKLSNRVLAAMLMVADRYEVLDLKRNCALALDAKAADGDAEASEWLLRGFPDVVLDATLEVARGKVVARTFGDPDRTLSDPELRERFVGLPSDLVRNLFAEHSFRCPEDSLLHACVTWLRANGSLDSDARTLFPAVRAELLSAEAIRWTIKNFEPLARFFTSDVLCDALAHCQRHTPPRVSASGDTFFKLTYDSPGIPQALHDFESKERFDACLHATPVFVYGRWRRPFVRFRRCNLLNSVFVGFESGMDSEDPTSFVSRSVPPIYEWIRHTADIDLSLTEPFPVLIDRTFEDTFMCRIREADMHKLRSFLERPLEIHCFDARWVL